MFLPTFYRSFFLYGKEKGNLKKAGQKSSAACIIEVAKTLVSASYDINEVKHRPNQVFLSFKPHPSDLFCSVTVAGNLIVLLKVFYQN